MARDADVREHRYASVLSIAGSDSIGGAGIQADIKTCTALGVYAMTAVTAVTAQNTMGVRSYQAAGAEMVRAQLDAVFDDVTPDAVKIGMLPDAATVRAVADVLSTRYDRGFIVLDPVAVATSGDRLSDDTATAEMTRRLLPIATIVTPNIPEAEILAETKITDVDDMRRAARIILSRCHCHAVLVKGGHLVAEYATQHTATTSDILWIAGDSEPLTLSGPVIETRNTHGTGCTLSSAIASMLALGYPLRDAVARAKAWLTDALADGADYRFGHGHGPVNHLHNIKPNKNSNESNH